jgi:hypothetical protein
MGCSFQNQPRLHCKKSEVTMKNSSSTGAKLFSRAFLPLIAVMMFVATGVRAGLTLINLGSQNES